jgi:hypothetical protein
MFIWTFFSHSTWYCSLSKYWPFLQNQPVWLNLFLLNCTNLYVYWNYSSIFWLMYLAILRKHTLHMRFITISTCKWTTVPAVIIPALPKNISIQRSALQFYYSVCMWIRYVHLKLICLLHLKRRYLHSNIISWILYRWVSRFHCFEQL